MRRRKWLAIVVTATCLSASLVAGSAAAFGTPYVMEISSSSQNVTAGEEFDVKLLFTGTGGYGDVKVESVELTLNYEEGVNAEEVSHGSWFEGDNGSPERSYEIDTEARNVTIEQSLDSGDTGIAERLATVEFVAEQEFEGDVSMEITDLNVKLTNGQPAHTVTTRKVLNVHQPERDLVPMPGFAAAAALVAFLAVALRRVRG